jgi:hypothetical protein
VSAQLEERHVIASLMQSSRELKDLVAVRIIPVTEKNAASRGWGVKHPDLKPYPIGRGD